MILESSSRNIRRSLPSPRDWKLTERLPVEDIGIAHEPKPILTKVVVLWNVSTAHIPRSMKRPVPTKYKHEETGSSAVGLCRCETPRVHGPCDGKAEHYRICERAACILSEAVAVSQTQKTDYNITGCNSQSIQCKYDLKRP